MEKAIRKKIKEGVGYGILQVEEREDVYILYPPGPQALNERALFFPSPGLR